MTEATYHEALPTLRSLARRIAGQRFRQIGEDVMQAGALALLTAPPFDPQHGAFRVWVKVHARYAMLDECQKSLLLKPRRWSMLRRTGAPLPTTQGFSQDASELRRRHTAFDEVDRKDAVAAALRPLHHYDRQLIEAYYLRGETYRRIGEKAGVCQVTAIQHIRNALGRAHFAARGHRSEA